MLDRLCFLFIPDDFYKVCLQLLSPHDSGEGYSNSGCLSVRPSVTLSCLRNNLSKHGWI